MQIDILEDLNPEQREAVTHQKGPLLIIAGAGTGKTTVITRRIAWLISEGLAKTDEILALTFTDKAAQEMQERVDILVPYGYTDIWISTFHAFGDRILREHALEIGLSPDFNVLTRPESAVFFREHLFEFPISYYRPLAEPTRFIEAMIDLFSRARDEDTSPSEYLKYARKLKEKSLASPEDEALREEAIKELEIAQCYEKYIELLMRENKVDFANQFYLTLQLFRNHPLILKKYQEKFKYILVDEFQDTNFAQYQLVKLLSTKFRNITVTGDDDQCIYRWRGAAYSNLLKFIEDFPDAKKISIIRNFRSHQINLDYAYRLIQHNNPERFEVKAGINKRLIGVSSEGKPPEHLHFDTVSNEADNVVRIIREKVESKGYNYNDFAILVRSNSDALPFIRSLNMYSVPWRFTGNQGLYHTEEIRLVISFLRLLSDLSDSLSLYYLATHQIYSVPIAELSKCMSYCRKANCDLFGVFKNIDSLFPEGISLEAREIIKKIVEDIEKFLEASLELPTGNLLYKFLTETGYLKSLTAHPSLENEVKIKNLAKFFEIVSNFSSLTKEDHLVKFIHYLDLLISCGDDPATAEADLDTPSVNIMTIHKAKGLEFRVVFLVSLVLGKFPWPHRHQPIELPEALIKDILPTGDFHLQEERRLFYVGMTRAKEELYLTSSQDYGGGRKRKISQFVYEAMGRPQEEKILKVKSEELIEQKALASERPTVSPIVIPEDKILSLSYYSVDDYLSCPLKYKYVHILRIPVIQHHTVIYGKALHNVILRYYEYKVKGLRVTLEDLIKVFESSLEVAGFLTYEHRKERTEKGRKALEKFYNQEEEKAQIPTYVEKDFSIMLDNIRITGRWDRIDIKDGEVYIIDFKSSEITKKKEADKKTKESLQLCIYSLAYKELYGKIPDYVQLYFLESGLIGEAKLNDKDLEETIGRIREVSFGIRKQDFSARPRFMACNYCAYQSICPEYSPSKMH